MPRKLNINEDDLRKEIKEIVEESVIGLEMKDLIERLRNKGFNVSPQVIRRNLAKLKKQGDIML